MLRLFAVVLSFMISSAAIALPVSDAAAERALSPEEMAEIVDFVVGNAVFSLYHQAGHMMMERYHVQADSEAGADEFALRTLLEPRSGAGDQTLIDAIDSWRLSFHRTASAGPAVIMPDRHAIDADRASALTCEMVGADPQGFSDVADAASLSPAARTNCAATYQALKARWTSELAPFRRAPGAAAKPLPVAYDEPADGPSAEATILRDNKVLEEVATRLGDQLALPAPPTIRARSCGDLSADYDAAKNELVLCYELSAYHASLILHDIENRD